ncbi:fascin domain-containing protein [Dactylosporangium sp. NPDC051541]|uniref:fascin domain-containing protein n=1 Tax=Dactylosporangium sp. NPDC051541 TaxID=3363977 RepID=UPI003788F76E
MKLRGKLLSAVVTVGAALAAVMVTPGMAHATTDPFACYIQTSDHRHYITAVGGGGRTTDVLHTNVTVPGSWERFTRVPQGDLFGHFALRTASGNYLTTLASGGLSGDAFADVFHTDATRIQGWELFSTTGIAAGGVGIRVADNHFMAALNGGGRTSRTFDTNRVNLIQPDTAFFFTCNV